jgi:Tol biopolymer transport system component
MTASPDVVARLTAALADRYRVEREIGAGGMATVFLAHDLKHEREVAIKVLHPDLGAAIGGERFLAEIKTTAKLQHPHILPLLDSGGADGLLFYVMPLVEGETLRARLTRERQLPVDVAVRIATEVAGALDYAHRHGVIHRDIKPENILLHDGRAVVADFGIALAVSAASGSRMTQTGLSLGTPQYMSPEQAMGEKVIDARSDVYAIGAVLYEMLTGEPPFSGATVQAIVAKVLTEKPMYPSAVRDTIPPHVESTLLKALAKLPADRFADAAKFAEALENPAATASYRTAATSTDAAPITPRGAAIRALPWVVAAASIGALVWTQFGDTRSTTPTGSAVLAELPPIRRASPVMIGASRLLAMAQDGSQIAFLGMDSLRVPSLFVRSTGSASVWKVPESEFGGSASFSPDGRTLAYTTTDGLQVIQIGESRARVLMTGRDEDFNPLMTAWDGDTALLFINQGRLYRTRLSGDGAKLLAESPDSGLQLAAPVPTRDGRAVLLAISPRGRPGTGRVAVLRRGATTVEEVGIAGVRPQMVGDDVLVFLNEGAIHAVRVDPGTFRPLSDPVVVVPNSVGQLVTAFGMAVSADGVLAFVLGQAAGEADLLLVDRQGTARSVLPQRQAYRFPRFSPTGDRLAFGVTGDRGVSSGDIWTVGLADAKPLRVTSDNSSYHPVWSPDSKSLVFLRRDSLRIGRVFRTSVDGTSPPSALLTEGIGPGVWEMELTPDQNTLVFRIDNAAMRRDILTARVDSGQAIKPLLATRFDEKGIALAPDGKWLAYSSDEGGASDVYIRRLDPSSPRWRVSEGGGVEPRWAKTGELFFRRGDSVFVSRVNTSGAEPQLGTVQFVLAGPYATTMFEPVWDVSPDGKRFAFVRPVDSGRLQLMVYFNWIDQVRRGAPRTP